MIVAPEIKINIYDFLGGNLELIKQGWSPLLNHQHSFSFCQDAEKRPESHALESEEEATGGMRDRYPEGGESQSNAF